MIRLRNRYISASAVPTRTFRFSALSGVVALAAGSMLALTSCALGSGCSKSYSAPATGAAGGAAAAPGNGTGAALTDPRSPITVDPGARPGAQPADALPASTILPLSATVTLVTGDRVQVDTTPGGQSVTPAIASATGARSTGSPGFVRFTWGGDQYLIPDAAVPYIGSTLDLRLFDASYLVRAGLDDAHASSLPLQVSGDAGALPGLHAAGRTGGAEAATLAKTQAPAVGRLLAATWRNHTQSGALSRLGSITLAQPKGAPELPTLPATPAQLPTAGGSGSSQHWHTVTLKFIGNDGAPGTGIGWLQNLGDARLATVLVNSDDLDDQLPPIAGASGPVSFSVPDGTYSIEASVLTPHDGTANGADAALVVLPQVTVKADQTVVLDARTATTYQAAVDPAVDAPLRIDEMTCGVRASPAAVARVDPAAPSRWAWCPSPAADTPHRSSALPRRRRSPKASSASRPKACYMSAPRHLRRRRIPVFPRLPERGHDPSSLKYRVAAADLTTVHARVYDNPDAGCADANPELWPNVYFPWAGSTRCA